MLIKCFSAAGAAVFGVFGLRRPRLVGNVQREGFAVFGNAVDGAQQFSHGGDEREFRRFADDAEAIVEGAQPGVSLHGDEHRHPKSLAQARVAEGSGAGPCCGSLAGLFEARDDADIGREGRGAF